MGPFEVQLAARNTSRSQHDRRLNDAIGLAMLVVIASGCGSLPSFGKPLESASAFPAAASRSDRPTASPTTFVVPTAQPTSAPPKPLAGASYANPRIATEVQHVFELFYETRTLRSGASFDVAGLRSLVDGAYADYTLPLFDREIRDAQAGALQQVRFRDISVRVDVWAGFVVNQDFPIHEDVRDGKAWATVTRTREELRKDSPATSETATYRFRLERQRIGSDSVRWLIYDFSSSPPPLGNSPDSGWVSDQAVIGGAQVAAELGPFFDEFYAARTFGPGRPLDVSRSARLTMWHYYAYTIPLLERTKAEADSGAIQEVRYANVSVRLESWDASASGHGGLATVAVTRTAIVTRSSGAEPPETATYRFRVHRHQDEGRPTWYAIDFFRPDANEWVAALAGATLSLPPIGHG